MSDTREHLPTFFLAELADAPVRVALGESAAHHARVRRLAVGERVGLTDGVGHYAAGIIDSLDRREVAVRVESLEQRRAPRELHLYVPVADRERMLWLAEKATEIGVTSWRAVHFRRSASVSPRGEGDAFQAKLRARMISALEQSNGAWIPRLEPDVPVAQLAVSSAGGQRFVLDARGRALGSMLEEAQARHLLVGPEGGVEADELELLRAAGWLPAGVAENTLRFETAALVAVAILQT